MGQSMVSYPYNKRLTIIPNKNLITNIGYDKKASGPNPKNMIH